MKRLEELYKPRAKKEKEWWDAANKIEKHPLSKGDKSDFTGDSVKVYDRDKYGAKAGKDTAGEVCEDEQLDELSRRGIISRYINKAKDDPKKDRKEGVGLALKKKWGDKKYGFTEPKVKATEEKNDYPETIDDEEDKDYRPYWVKKRKRQDTA